MARPKSDKEQVISRLDEGQTHLVKFAAELDESSQAEIIREAVTAYIGNRAAIDEVFAAEWRATGRRMINKSLANIAKGLGRAFVPEEVEYPASLIEPELGTQPAEASDRQTQQ
ncbi:MAG TPA: hypothetical protein VG604_05050 [Candidatus Saccharimonadales bacterium]|nr:hypothetical protein [Candidatus Saccharimonadales bacterium]